MISRSNSLIILEVFITWMSLPSGQAQCTQALLFLIRVQVRIPVLTFVSLKPLYTFGTEKKNVHRELRELRIYIKHVMTRQSVRKQGWDSPLFSPDSDDRLSLNFHSFFNFYISCDTRSVGLWILLFTESVQWL